MVDLKRFLYALTILCVSFPCLAGLDLRDAVVSVTTDVGQCSAVCVTETGLFISVGHGGFTKGKSYEATTEDATYTLKCVSHRTLKDDKGEGVVLLQDTDESPRHTYFAVGKTPELADPVYGIGYAGGNFAYCEGIVVGMRNGARFLEADFRMLGGASGGALCNAKDELIGILSTRTLLATESDSRGVKGFFEARTTWIGVEVFQPCVRDYLRSIP